MGIILIVLKKLFQNVEPIMEKIQICAIFFSD